MGIWVVYIFGYYEYCYGHSYTGFCVNIFLSLLDLYLEEELLGNMITLYLTFWVIFSCDYWLFVYLLWSNAYLNPLPV